MLKIQQVHSPAGDGLGLIKPQEAGPNLGPRTEHQGAVTPERVSDGPHEEV